MLGNQGTFLCWVDSRVPALASRGLYRLGDTSDAVCACACVIGEVPERSIGTVSKTVVPLRVPRVRIPPSPPQDIDASRFRQGSESFDQAPGTLHRL
jgi:hypothetical protein